MNLKRAGVALMFMTCSELQPACAVSDLHAANSVAVNIPPPAIIYKCRMCLWVQDGQYLHGTCTGCDDGDGGAPQQ